MNRMCLAVMAAVAWQTFAGATYAADPSFETVSRCFFVYAPIFETGKKLPHPKLFQFGQTRVAWMAGHSQANKKNPDFKRVFEGGLSQNKRAGIELQTDLQNAIASRDQTLFDSVINKAISCDRALGIKTGFVPEM